VIAVRPVGARGMCGLIILSVRCGTWYLCTCTFVISCVQTPGKRKKAGGKADAKTVHSVSTVSKALGARKDNQSWDLKTRLDHACRRECAWGIVNGLHTKEELVEFVTMGAMRLMPDEEGDDNMVEPKRRNVRRRERHRLSRLLCGPPLLCNVNP